MTRAEAIPTIRDDDTRLIIKLQREIAQRDRHQQRIAEALGLPLDADINQIVVEIERLR